MEERQERTVTESEENRLFLAKWLRILLMAQSVMLLNMVLAPVQLPLRLVGWITVVMTALILVALFSLRVVQERYQKAALYFGIGFAGELVSQFIGVTLFGSLLSICSIVGQYQEYHGHSELMADYEPSLAGKWSSLFYWQLGVGLLCSLGAIIGVVIAVGIDIPENTIITTTLVIVALMSGAVQLAYLRYLKRMIDFFRK